MPSRPALLYLSLKIPRPSGHGAAMRTGLHVRLLSEVFDVFLVVVTEESDVTEDDIPPEIRQACADVHVVRADGHRDLGHRIIWQSRNEHVKLLARALHPYPLSLGVYTRRTERAVIDRLKGIHFDSIHAFHVHMAPLAIAIARECPNDRVRLVLDMDDFESDAARRRSETMRETMGSQWYALNRLDALKIAFWEKRFVRRFDQVWLSSRDDSKKVSARLGVAHSFWVPNGFQVPPALQQTGRGAPFTFLFVGTMSYSPNDDAAIYFCNEILPLLRRIAPSEFRVQVVGRGPTDALLRLASRHPEVVVTGQVPEVGSFYRDAHVVIAPMRLGSGTKIKLLEAFSLGVPVVATPAGAAGLEATNGVHLLVADQPKSFAEACIQMMLDGELRQRTAQNAFEFVTERYGVDAIRSVMRDRYVTPSDTSPTRQQILPSAQPLATGR